MVYIYYTYHIYSIFIISPSESRTMWCGCVRSHVPVCVYIYVGMADIMEYFIIFPYGWGLAKGFKFEVATRADCLYYKLLKWMLSANLVEFH